MLVLLRRHIRPISVSGLTLEQEKSTVPCKWLELDERSVQNTNSKPIATYRLVMSVPLRGAT
jgi:hypothetical protein